MTLFSVDCAIIAPQNLQEKIAFFSCKIKERKSDSAG
jgi:hypothetical protein